MQATLTWRTSNLGESIAGEWLSVPGQSPHFWPQEHFTKKSGKWQFLDRMHIPSCWMADSSPRMRLSIDRSLKMLNLEFTRLRASVSVPLDGSKKRYHPIGLVFCSSEWQCTTCSSTHLEGRTQHQQDGGLGFVFSLHLEEEGEQLRADVEMVGTGMRATHYFQRDIFGSHAPRAKRRRNRLTETKKLVALPENATLEVEESPRRGRGCMPLPRIMGRTRAT